MKTVAVVMVAAAFSVLGLVASDAGLLDEALFRGRRAQATAPTEGHDHPDHPGPDHDCPPHDDPSLAQDGGRDGRNHDEPFPSCPRSSSCLRRRRPR